ncbi:CTD small phosphatase-like protein [Pseudoscourfieldia marina]
MAFFSPLRPTSSLRPLKKVRPRPCWLVWSGWLALAFVWLCVLASASASGSGLVAGEFSGELPLVQDSIADDIHGVGHELERIQTQAAGSRRDFGPGDVVQHEDQQAANDDSASASSASASASSSSSASENRATPPTSNPDGIAQTDKTNQQHAHDFVLASARVHQALRFLAMLVFALVVALLCTRKMPRRAPAGLRRRWQAWQGMLAVAAAFAWDVARKASDTKRWFKAARNVKMRWRQLMKRVRIIWASRNKPKGAVQTTLRRTQTVVTKKLLEPLSRAAAGLWQEDGTGCLLPPQQASHRGKLTVVLDLDETLVLGVALPHESPELGRSRWKESARRRQLRSFDLPPPLGGPGGVRVYERPGAREFLAKLSAACEVVLFTSASQSYAEAIRDRFESTHEPTGPIHVRRGSRGASPSPVRPAVGPQQQQRRATFTATLDRSSTRPCAYCQYAKDLSRLGRPPGRVVLVDNDPYAFVLQPSSGIPIRTFRGDPNDCELLGTILPLCLALAELRDVRPVLARRFAMHEWFERRGCVLPIAAETDAAAPSPDGSSSL